jgi:carbonic anhydrase
MRRDIDHAVGHSECAGIRSAMEGTRYGLVDTWLRHIHERQARHRTMLMAPAYRWAVERMSRDAGTPPAAAKGRWATHA